MEKKELSDCFDTLRRYGNTVVPYSDYKNLGEKGLKELFAKDGLDISIDIIDDKVSDDLYSDFHASTKRYFPPTVKITLLD